MLARLLCFFLLAELLVGCSGGSLKNLYNSGSRLVQRITEPVVPPSLNDRFQYLRVKVRDREALLVLGELDSSSNLEQQIWFSRDRNVLATFGGRVMRTTGLEINVVETRFISMPPAWGEIGQGATYLRSRDFMPGYHFGAPEEVSIQRLARPPAQLWGGERTKYLADETVIWFEESFKSGSAFVYSYFAFRETGQELRLLMSIQCITKTFCLELERVGSREG